MMVEKHRKTIFWMVALSESMHVFCCVLPTVFSVLSLMTGVGMISVMPAFMVRFHDVMHHWEVPMIIASAFVLALGWGLDWYARKIDCHDTGCGHGPCAPKKNKAHFILKIATLLFIVNVLVYAGVHRNADVAAQMDAVEVHQGHAH